MRRGGQPYTPPNAITARLLHTMVATTPSGQINSADYNLELGCWHSVTLEKVLNLWVWYYVSVAENR